MNTIKDIKVLTITKEKKKYSSFADDTASKFQENQ